MNDRSTTAYYEGVEACRHHKIIFDCPYTAEDPRQREWDDGWFDEHEGKLPRFPNEPRVPSESLAFVEPELPWWRRLARRIGHLI